MRKFFAIRPLVVLLVLAGVLIVAGANAHLFYVALTSQPGCVAHLKEPGSRAGQFRAAKSAC
ncbi:hypothetical protein [Jiella marina]|uniref:hypothetical protein n=1 Tax=Jiella sp. LLJ827 TaxID=2917712 RepID=UPI0021009B3A|nr:hypothetical protein [Jiella sp. LLJ827]MCQ0990509.1 hypothetical protein [Jiella sp. LLJ827]